MGRDTFVRSVRVTRIAEREGSRFFVTTAGHMNIHISIPRDAQTYALILPLTILFGGGGN